MNETQTTENQGLTTDLRFAFRRFRLPAIINFNIFDQITVWDSGSGNSPDGKNSTSNFISGLYKSVPPLQEIFNMAGMELPDYLKGKTEAELKLMAEQARTKQATIQAPETKPEPKKEEPPKK